MFRKTTQIILPVFTALVLLAGCGQSAREKQLDEREKQLQLQQQELIQKANQLALREAALEQKAQSLDSTAIHRDSLEVQYPHLAGNWNVQMVCSQATCAGSAIGDRKTEQWSFALRGSSVIAQAYTQSRLSRVYVGQYQEGLLQLMAEPADTTEDNNTQIAVFLRTSGDSLSMTGKRTIIRPGCQIVYNLTMKKQ